MTIFEICSIILDAVIAVLLVGYGLWFRDVVKTPDRSEGRDD